MVWTAREIRTCRHPLASIFVFTIDYSQNRLYIILTDNYIPTGTGLSYDPASSTSHKHWKRTLSSN
jgi:hypothetical protein